VNSVKKYVIRSIFLIFGVRTTLYKYSMTVSVSIWGNLFFFGAAACDYDNAEGEFVTVNE